MLKNNMDTSVNPCKCEKLIIKLNFGWRFILVFEYFWLGDDFYQFTCGNYVKRVKVPSDQSAVSQFKSLDKTVRSQLAGKLEFAQKY